MKCLIMAAGRGTRISRHLMGQPKCTVDIGGEPLIRYTVRMLQEHGIRQVGIIVGYAQQAVRDALAGLDVRFYENPFFDVTNSIASLWFARDFLDGDEDMLFMNGDVYMESALLERILADRRSPVMFADESRIKEADYRFRYPNGLLEKYGKDLPDEETTGEYIGEARINAELLPVFSQRLEKMIFSQQHGLWWENVLYAHLEETPVYVADCGGLFWAEVDYIEDYQRILKHTQG